MQPLLRNTTNGKQGMPSSQVHQETAFSEFSFTFAFYIKAVKQAPAMACGSVVGMKCQNSQEISQHAACIGVPKQLYDKSIGEKEEICRYQNGKLNARQRIHMRRAGEYCGEADAVGGYCSPSDAPPAFSLLIGI